MSIVDVLDFKKVCRTCLSFGNLKSLYDETSTQETLANMLMVCTSVKYCPDDDLPQYMCTDCISELNQSYKFALKCQEIDEELRIYKQKLLSVENAKRQSVIITSSKTASPQNILGPDEINNEINLETANSQNKNRKKIVINTNIFKNVATIILDDLDPEMSNSDNIDLETHELDQILNAQSESQNNLDPELFEQHSLDHELSERQHLDHEIFETNNNIAQKASKTYREISETHDLDQLSQSLTFENDIEDDENDIFRAVTPVIEQFPMNIKTEYISDCDTEILDPETAIGNISDCDTVILETEKPDAYISDCDTEILEIEKSEKDVSDCETVILKVEKLEEYISDCETEILVIEKPNTNIKPCKMEILEPDKNEKLSITKSNQKDEASFLCTICKKTFDKQVSLESHMQTHNQPKIRDLHSCRYCFSTFRDMKKFREHIPVHNGERPYTCRECSYKVKGIKKFQDHKRFHHEERRLQRALYHKNKDAAKPYFCGDFSPSFKTRTHFSYHMRTHQTERYSHNNAYTRHKVSNSHEFKGFSCRYCDMSFLRRNDLMAHSYQMHPRPKRYTSTVYNTQTRDEEMPFV